MLYTYCNDHMLDFLLFNLIFIIYVTLFFSFMHLCWLVLVITYSIFFFLVMWKFYYKIFILLLVTSLFLCSKSDTFLHYYLKTRQSFFLLKHSIFLLVSLQGKMKPLEYFHFLYSFLLFLISHAPHDTLCYLFLQIPQIPVFFYIICQTANQFFISYVILVPRVLTQNIYKQLQLVRLLLCINI